MQDETGSAIADVLFITRKWPPAVGGMETYSVELVEELGKRIPLDVKFLPGNVDGSPPSFANLIAFTISTIRSYLRRRTPPTVLHIGDMACWPLGLLACFSTPRPLVVLSAHGTDVSYPRRRTLKGRIYGSYLRLGARLLRSATVIANSKATAAVAAESNWRTTEVIPLATRKTSSDNKDYHDGSLLFVGRLVERKGCLWFVRNVLPHLPAGMRLNVVGTLWDKSEMEALAHPQVTYVGPLLGANLDQAYRESMCVVIPNIVPSSGEFEGFGLVAPEAAASGGVVLAAAIGGLQDAVIAEETGFLLPSGDPAPWAAKIKQVAAWSERERRKFIANSTMRAHQVYSWERVARDVMSVYEDAVKSRSTAGKRHGGS